MSASNDYRNLLVPPRPSIEMAKGKDALQWADTISQVPLVAETLDAWTERLNQPFQGVTCDGRCEHGLFALADEGAPTDEAARAAGALLAHLTEAQRSKLRFPIDAPQWRIWSNPEFLVNDYGLRLERETDATRQLILAILAASMGETGFRKAQDCMRTNAFLGELVGLPLIMNEWSFNFALFGEPGGAEPWGWNLWGHHLCLNCVFVGRQMVVSPVFMGAEPNVIDKGPYAGTLIFGAQETVGLSLMQSLSPGLRDRAVTYSRMQDPAMPEGRLHPMDERHLGGAFRDNRVIPYEGIPATELGAGQRDQLMTLADAFLEVLPPEPRRHKLNQIARHLDRTWWSWIGGYGDEDPFYYRIQSPVILLEFDHHSGVWLNNEEPAKCHIHTVIRTPNGNDYGKDLLRQHYQAVHPGKAPGQV